METWITFTDADVFEPTAQERISIAAVKKRDDLADICGQVTRQIRQAYELGSRELGVEATIPEGLKIHAVAIALWRFVSEGVAKNEGIQTKQREQNYKDAMEFLNKISRGEIGRTSAPSIGKNTRRFTDCTEDGI